MILHTAKLARIDSELPGMMTDKADGSLDVIHRRRVMESGCRTVIDGKNGVPRAEQWWTPFRDLLFLQGPCAVYEP
jgi:hypothetical protein